MNCMHRILVSVAYLLNLSVVLGNVAYAQAIPFDSDRWEIDAQESRIEEHLGKKSLFIRGGLAWIRDEDFENGVIEFDVCFSAERGFMGGIWRLQDRHNYEEFCIRPHQSSVTSPYW